jgi:hypothetical protein
LLVQDVWTRLIRLSHYKSVSHMVKPLSFTIQDLEQLIRRLKLNAIIIRKSFSVYANRPSLLIQL